MAPPSSALRGRVVVAAVAVGAFAAAAAGQTLKAGQPSASDDIAPLPDSKNASAAIGVGGNASAVAPEVLAVAKPVVAAPEVQQIASTNQIVQARAEAAAAAKAEAERPKFVRPSSGAITSGFGARWGTTHYGLDFAAPMGTPIYAAADGVVIEAGSASGFGLWVRIQHDDGTVTVYGHMQDYSVREGERVKAGEQIARTGNRGQSTGPHLHFEVWESDGGRKINPRPWLIEHGVAL